MGKFWIMNKKDEETAELLLFGAISSTSWWGDEVTPKQFADDLAAMGNVKQILVRINSPGGDVFAAIAISGMLRDHPAEIIAKVDGLCASAASVIMVNCDKVRVSAESLVMIHEPTWDCQGTAEDMDKAAAVLRKATGNIIETYARRTGIDKAELAQMLKDETWMNGTEAVEKKFADELSTTNTLAASSWSMKQVNSAIAASLIGAIKRAEAKPTASIVDAAINDALAQKLHAELELLSVA